jgi:hypothetical protein
VSLHKEEAQARVDFWESDSYELLPQRDVTCRQARGSQVLVTDPLIGSPEIGPVRDPNPMHLRPKGTLRKLNAIKGHFIAC